MYVTPLTSNGWCFISSTSAPCDFPTSFLFDTSLPPSISATRPTTVPSIYLFSLLSFSFKFTSNFSYLQYFFRFDICLLIFASQFFRQPKKDIMGFGDPLRSRCKSWQSSLPNEKGRLHSIDKNNHGVSVFSKV